MRRIRILAGVAAAIGLGAAIVAQAPVDFSGRWVLAPDPPPPAGHRGGKTPSGPMGSGWGADITIRQDAASIVIEYAQFTRGDMQPPMKLAYPLDGSESRHTINVGRGPQEQRSRASWDGNTLVITTTHQFKPGPSEDTLASETRHVLSLEQPAVLVVETTRGGVMGGEPSTTKTVYVRKSS
jgi:hypothetical protein